MNLPGSISTPARNETGPASDQLNKLPKTRHGTRQFLLGRSARLMLIALPRRTLVVSFLTARPSLPMYEPRQTDLLATVTLILTGLFSLVVALLVREAVGQPPNLYDRLPYGVAARPFATSSNRWPNLGTILSSAESASPHPAVARIVVPEGMATAYGTGTLIDVREEFGLVVTNWHVVRDATASVEVVFPGGFRSPARALKVDPDWDLAALVIWRPTIEPVKLASRAPRQGEALTIHGYGQGQYRIARGKCTQYYAPRPDYPQEMVEINVEARQGDSGGPIFNDRGELAGVLFGAGQGTTIGSFAGRVESFLATLAPDIGQPVSPDAKNPLLAGGPPDFTANPLQDECVRLPSDPWDSHRENAIPPIGLKGTNTDWQPASVAEWSDSSRSTTNAQEPKSDASADLRSAPGETLDDAEITASQSTRSLILERVKSMLAIIGLYTVCIHIVRMVS